MSVKIKPATSEYSRSQPKARERMDNYRTVANETAESQFTRGHEKKNKKKLMFRSDNLGNKMNDYLNLYLSSAQGEEISR